MRVGLGYDVHKLVENRKLILGGVEIPYEKGLLGHSDADVLLHAIMDALLGAAALGDIGKHFPDSDDRYKGISSIKLLGEVGKLLDECEKYGVNSDYIKVVGTKTGHTIIQIDENAQNCILLYGGANQKLTEEYIDDVIEHFDKGDVLLLQNEVNNIPYIVDRAYDKGMIIALNPSPFNEKLDEVDMSKISIFILKEIEGEELTGCSKPGDIISCMIRDYSGARVVLTLGGDGAIYADKDNYVHQTIFKVDAVDTTAAGDTFTGYFLAGLMEGMNIKDVLRLSAKASSIAVTRKGAIPSIPYRKEV